MFRYLQLLLLIFLLSAASCTRNPRQTGGENTPDKRADYPVGEVLFSDDFSGDLSNWLAEGRQPEIIDGKMNLDTPVGTTVWLKPYLQGNVMIEYDVTVIEQGGPNDRVSDLNCFWMATDPCNPGDLFAASEQRAGVFARYHNLNLYYVGYGGNTNSTTRFRRYNSGNRELLGEYNDRLHLITPNHQYHIRLICYENTVEYRCDGERLFCYEDPEPYTRGHFGLRTVQNHLTMDNFRVVHLLKAK
ncbi:MAG: hypothetical protein JW715_00085 [Sedimentisphaerales bacterium]|nr:hypothetical protein [Sedimentisphaerales bacterium]